VPCCNHLAHLFVRDRPSLIDVVQPALNLLNDVQMVLNILQRRIVRQPIEERANLSLHL